MRLNTYNEAVSSDDADPVTVTTGQTTPGINFTLSETSLVKGDLDGDGDTTLADAIIALQVLAGMEPSAIRTDYGASGADVNGDSKIGPVELGYILQVVAGVR